MQIRERSLCRGDVVMYRKRAFTLIELLVVISVIATLLAVLMPALNSARGLGQAAACRGNLKGYTLAVQMYTADNDQRFCDPDTCYFSSRERYPEETDVTDYLHLRWCNGDVYLRTHPEYGGSLYRFITDARAFICPTFKVMTRSASEDQFFQAYGDTIQNYQPWYNYTMNAYLGPLDTPGGAAVKKIRVANIDNVKNPSDTFSFTEESSFVDTAYNQSGLNDTYMIPLGQDDALAYIQKKGGTPWNVKPGPEGVGKFFDVIAGFHHSPSGDKMGGRGNCAFVDGHVEARFRAETFPLAWPN